MIQDKFKFIDLFCGIGGFHQVMSSLGGECVFACDIDKDCRETYKVNYGIEPHSDITSIDALYIPEHDVLCAGFPCQSFSKAGNRLGFNDTTKGTLFFDVCRILDYHRPRYALLENVRNLASHDNGNTWMVIRESLVNLGYNVPVEPIIFSPNYIGIPQHRERVFIMCVRNDVGVLPQFQSLLYEKPCNIETVLQDDTEIENIERYRLSDDKIEYIELWNEFIQNIDNKRLPGFPIWSDFLRPLDDNLKSIDWNSTPQWKRNFIFKNSMLFKDNQKFISEWLNKARRNRNFFGAKARLEWQAGYQDNPDIWKNIIQIRPSGLRVKHPNCFPALVTMVEQIPIVGDRKRFLTPRECARLQSFPDSFIINPSDSKAYKQFGNSINIDVAMIFAKFMFGDKETVEKYSDTQLSLF